MPSLVLKTKIPILLRVIFLNLDVETCKKRLTAVAVDWCTGRLAVPGSGPRVLPYPRDSAAKLDEEVGRKLNFFLEVST